MVTLRAYANAAEAALAKSLLDDHNILCGLADENAYLYGGAPLAMPVRIVVADEEADEADRILRNAGGHFADFDPAPDSMIQESRETARQKRRSGEEPVLQQSAKNNPWEILAFASLLLLPGIGLLVQKHDLVLVAWKGYKVGRTSITFFSPATAHVLGALVIAVALLLTMLFFYTRRAIMREQVAAAADLVSR